MARVKVGWVASNTLVARRQWFNSLRPPVSMRIASVARWLNANEQRLTNEMYRRGRDYDVVVFFKTMDAPAQAEAGLIQERGGRVVFDANVNYYETWGDYDIADTRPTEEQQRDVTAMTQLADWVVADSSYLLDVVRRYSDRASWIPDNVDLRRYSGLREHEHRSPVRLVWSGVAKKAQPFVGITDALAGVRNAELVLVSDARPPVLDELRQALPTRYVRFFERRYARLLRSSDVIVSPKRLSNAYEVGHTEWKITLGMAVGLPAVASSQRSYVEAIEAEGGGLIADTPEEWTRSLQRLVDDHELRAALGEKARRTVVERYSTPVVARSYGDLLLSLA